MAVSPATFLISDGPYLLANSCINKLSIGNISAFVQPQTRNKNNPLMDIQGPAKGKTVSRFHVVMRETGCLTDMG